MQAYTHFMVGIGVQKALRRRVKSPVLRGFGLVFLGLLSHVIIDDFAHLTYHPSAPKPNDPFWVVYHVCVAMGSLAILIAWRRQILGMLCSVIPDLDWIVLRPLSHRFHWQGLDQGVLHDFFRGLPIFKQIDFVLSIFPDWTQIPAAALSELALAVGLLSFLLAQGRQKRDPSG